MRNFLKQVWNILCELFYDVYLYHRYLKEKYFNKKHSVHNKPQTAKPIPMQTYGSSGIPIPVDFYGAHLLITGKNKYNAIRNKHWAKA